jgi:hypothetical protein
MAKRSFKDEWRRRLRILRPAFIRRDTRVCMPPAVEYDAVIVAEVFPAEDNRPMWNRGFIQQAMNPETVVRMHRRRQRQQRMPLCGFTTRPMNVIRPERRVWLMGGQSHRGTTACSVASRESQLRFPN